MVHAACPEYALSTLAARPVGAIRTVLILVSGSVLTNERTMLVFPVPA